MRFQFSIFQLLEVVTIIGLTLGLDLWLFENRENRNVTAGPILILWSGLLGAYLATRRFYRIGSPACGGIAIVIALLAMLLNGAALALIAPGVILQPTPSNPLPLKNLDYFELGRAVLIASLLAGIVGSVFGLIAGAIARSAHSNLSKP